MERDLVYTQLNEVFRNIFNNQNIEVSDGLTANDVEGWDSLSHMLLISEIEDKFSFKFKLKELNKMRNVGDMVNAIITKV